MAILGHIWYGGFTYQIEYLIQAVSGLSQQGRIEIDTTFTVSISSGDISDRETTVTGLGSLTSEGDLSFSAMLITQGYIAEPVTNTLVGQDGIISNTESFTLSWSITAESIAQFDGSGDPEDVFGNLGGSVRYLIDIFARRLPDNTLIRIFGLGAAPAFLGIQLTGLFRVGDVVSDSGSEVIDLSPYV